MHRFFLISLLTCSFTTYSMEQDNSLSMNNFLGVAHKKIKSWISVSSNKKYIPERVKEIRNKRDKLVSQLKLGRGWEIWRFDDDNYKRFLTYIYYEKNQKRVKAATPSGHPFENIENDPELLAEFRGREQDGHSALGVAVICLTDDNDALQPSEYSFEKKRKQIEKLLMLGFKPTKADIDLAYLDLYERTPEDTHRKIMLLFLTQEYEDRREPGLPSLHLYIIQEIAKYITSEQPLLPLE